MSEQPTRSDNARFPTRHWFILGVLMAAFVGLGARAVEMQVNRQGFLKNQGDMRHLRVVRSPAHRGVITDRHGDPLALSTPVVSLWANPKELATVKEDWPALAKTLGFKPGALERLVAGRMTRDFVYLRRHVNPELAERALALDLTGVYSQREYRRYYPHAEVSAHVLGFTDIDDHGQEGMELAFDKWLTGRDGAKRVVRDRLGRVIEDVESIRTVRNGRALRLSLDQRLQYLAYRALKSAVVKHQAKSGSVVLVDVRTGEVLAMVNQPSFNPNSRSRGSSSQRRNRAVTDLLEPGSTMKPFTVAIGLQTGRFSPSSIIDTNPGSMQIGRHQVKDPRNYGRIDLATLIKKSSNVGSSRIALTLKAKEQWGWLSALGFGQPTGSGFPGESGGILSAHDSWGQIRRATLAFGYGLSVTPLQLAQAYVALANDGVMQPLSFQLVKTPPRGKRILSSEVSHAVRDMLEAVVDPDGSGALAAIPGYRVAGKTGTARKSEAGGYRAGLYVSAFAGMAPATDPRLVCVVVIDEPRGEFYYGGKVAAPVFQQVMADALRLLGVPPDRPDELGRPLLAAGQ
jgi:cell division protein FtsI (penicillin-binding protein 3)